MSTTASISVMNRELAERINTEARRDSLSPYAGRFVGIANGQVVAVADSWREVSRRLRQMEPDPSKSCCIEASADYDAPPRVTTLLASVERCSQPDVPSLPTAPRHCPACPGRAMFPSKAQAGTSRFRRMNQNQLSQPASTYTPPPEQP